MKIRTSGPSRHNSDRRSEASKAARITINISNKAARRAPAAKAAVVVANVAAAVAGNNSLSKHINRANNRAMLMANARHDLTVTDKVTVKDARNSSAGSADRIGIGRFSSQRSSENGLALI